MRKLISMAKGIKETTGTYIRMSYFASITIIYTSILILRMLIDANIECHKNIFVVII